MNAYDVMREWDRVTGKGPRSEEELDKVVPGLLADYDYEEWKTGLEDRNVDAILAGMKAWGLPVGPLAAFEIDRAIETHERTMDPRE